MADLKSPTALEDSSCGIDFLTNFWQEKYLQEYIRDGGSKIKFVTGRPGSGKTYFLRNMDHLAREKHYKTVYFSSRDIWMHDFREIYVEILNQCDIMDCLKSASLCVIQEMGYDPADIPENTKFIDFLSQNGASDPVTRRKIRSQLRTLSFYPAKITKYNARNMLHSLAEVIHMGGYSGLFIAIDDVEILISRTSLETVHYTKMKREDTYESIWQLIDDIDSMHHIFFVFAFDRDLIDNENAGIKSYQALWMRIQNEIVGERFNCFLRHGGS